MNLKEKYDKTQELLKNYRYASAIISFDEATICPKKDKRRSNEVSNFFQKNVLDIVSSDEYFLNLKELLGYDNLDIITKKKIKKEYEELEKIRKVPKKLLYDEYDMISNATLSWEEAKESLDFNEFESNLDKLVSMEKERIKYLEDKYKGYDVLLDEMEDDFTQKDYDNFFDLLEKELKPLLDQILKMPKKYNENIKNIKFDIDNQKKLTKIICNLMGYNNEVGVVGETIHPFTNGINSNDVRTTTRYDESLLFSNLYSIMHEVGHAIYELQVDPIYSETSLAGGASCALHESQSRFFENIIGRSYEFVSFLYPILKDLYKDELKDYSFEDIYYYINDVSNQFIRTEADELSYPFHIIIRYKIEKMLFNGTLDAKDIEKKYNELFEYYFNVTPKNKNEGCYQDIHWTSGFGYFPTYALGSAISCQLLHYMKKDIDVFALAKEGNFSPIKEWLKEHVHKYGASLKNKEIIKLATNEEFNPKYYVEYLKNKFKKIYDL